MLNQKESQERDREILKRWKKKSKLEFISDIFRFVLILIAIATCIIVSTYYLRRW